MQPPFRNGFTLIEIVSVLVVLASIQSPPPATFCFDAAGSVCGEDSLGNPNDTGILYCTASASDQTFSFGGGITLTLFAETGFVQ